MQSIVPESSTITSTAPQSTSTNQELSNHQTMAHFHAVRMFCCTLLVASMVGASMVGLPQPASAAQPGTASADWRDELLTQDISAIAADAKSGGDPKRGAIVFYQPTLSCSRCHLQDDPPRSVAPDLTRLPADTTDSHLIESILFPSRIIRKEFQVQSVVTDNGQLIQGYVRRDEPNSLTLSPTLPGGLEVVLEKSAIEEQTTSSVSAMPAGQIQQLASRQQFLDLVRYLMEIRDGGPNRAIELRPDPRLIAQVQIPEYESHLDHRSLIEAWGPESLQRGEKIYERVCANCHGTHDRPGSLPQSPRFAQSKLKNGSDPYSMYRTLTHGFGFMVPQTWMVPRQKYDVIHYIREAYFRGHQPELYLAIDDTFLNTIPKGDTTGPEPSSIDPWVAMDYGPSMIGTFEIEPGNIAFKGIATRLDVGPGGVSRGTAWQVFDHDTFRMAGFWHGDGFIDWGGIHFDGRHGAHPKIVGQVIASNPVGPGWAHPVSGSLDDPRPLARDGRPYGPLPRDWVSYKGHYAAGAYTPIHYQVGDTTVLESASLLDATLPFNTSPKPTEWLPASPVMIRHIELGERPRPLTLVVATTSADRKVVAGISGAADHIQTLQTTLVQAAPDPQTQSAPMEKEAAWQVENGSELDLDGRDYSISARFRTQEGGTLFSEAAPAGPWVPNAKALFVRDGRLVFDIGWVGAVTSNAEVNDGAWHVVTMTWRRNDGRVDFYIDGQPGGSGRLSPAKSLKESVIRFGIAADDFPDPSQFTGNLSLITFHDRRLTRDEIKQFHGSLSSDLQNKSPQEFLNELPANAVGVWQPETPQRLQSGSTASAENADRNAGFELRNAVSDRFHAKNILSGTSATQQPLVVGVRSELAGLRWIRDSLGRILLDIPAGDDSVLIDVWTGQLNDALPDQEDQSNSDAQLEAAARLLGQRVSASVRILPSQLIKDSQPRWPERMTTMYSQGSVDGPFATDLLTLPNENPWFAQVRTTGLDFFSDPNKMAVCTWDGDVWVVSGLADVHTAGQSSPLTWQRTASGLFQPLGLKIVNDTIYLTCRDQLVILRDLNGDGETDYYECFNNDHQVTEHFHEFAMGLQRDAAGNFYYAKSARHALKALVPHHGTLLRVSPDGTQTEILANGFRAANGVCLNPDGSFIVTDQEGHWNPKNRINWVRPSDDGHPRFYGNMYGYHDRTDESDEAMEKPLCWITNAFDRSPAELLWVDSPQWKPIDGALLNLSYGYGKVFLVPFEKKGDLVQGGMIELPIPSFPTGVMRGRFHPVDGQLYLCGMFAWAGNAVTPGGLYRLRRTDQPLVLPRELRTDPQTIRLVMTEALSKESVQNLRNISIKAWDLRRSQDYGSPHLNEHAVEVSKASLSSDGRTVELHIPELKPTWCMEIRYDWKTGIGAPASGVIHNTIHQP